jgi:enoyl-CoA hydratase/carnithine racemase
LDFVTEHYLFEEREHCCVLHLVSADGMNRLTSARVLALDAFLQELSNQKSSTANAQSSACKPLILCGNQQFFSVGADLKEIVALTASGAFEFSMMGQKLMQVIDDFPAPVFAAISGYCLGGGLDLALACDFRLCDPNAVFGHRGAALGLITGWGGTQRLPRLVGRARALQMFVAAEKLGAAEALDIGLVSDIAADPLARSIEIASRQEIYGQKPTA